MGSEHLRESCDEKVTSVIKAIFVIFHMFGKHEVLVHLKKLSQLHKNRFADYKQQENTHAGSHLDQGSFGMARCATNCPIPASLTFPPCDGLPICTFLTTRLPFQPQGFGEKNGGFGL